MRLKNVEIIPAVIVNEEDPDILGRVKCACPGIFDTETMDDEALPWVYPMMHYGYQGYAKMKLGQKIWLIINRETYEEYWYIPFFELNENTITAISDNKDSDVLLSRKVGDQDMQVYFNMTEGIMVKLGDNHVNIKMNGDIECLSNGYVVKIEGSHVYQGNNEGEYEPMVLGNKLMDLINHLSQNIKQLQKAAVGSPYTTHLGTPLTKMYQDIDKDKEKILSQDCSLT